MARYARAIIAVGVMTALVATPALAADGDDGVAVLDISSFITTGEGFEDRNGDGVPDFGDLAEGFPGIWDECPDDKTIASDAKQAADNPEDVCEERTIADFQRLVVDTIPNFNTTGDASVLVGPCGGLAIAYDDKGMSIDAMIDLGTDEPLIDVYTNTQAMTAGNPFKVDPAGTVAYWGFTQDIPAFSTEGRQVDVNYQEPALAFHDHIWTVAVMGISADRGGDPNQRDKNRNAGIVELGKILKDFNAGPIDLTELKAKVKAKGAIIDLYNDNELSTDEPEYLPDEFDQAKIEELAAGKVFCFGEGWTEFVGSGPPMTATAIASVLLAAGFAGLLFNVRPAQSWRSSSATPTPKVRP